MPPPPPPPYRDEDEEEEEEGYKAVEAAGEGVSGGGSEGKTNERGEVKEVDGKANTRINE